MLADLLFLAALGSTSGCATVPASVNAPGHADSTSALRESFESGTVIGGRVDLESLWIAPGSVVWVESNLDLRVSEVVRIEGLLVAFDAAPLGLLDAPNIRIASTLAIDVIGEVRGGRGLDAASGRGGNGSSINLAAPLVLIDGEVRSGDGGRGGAGACGGDGGDATVDGYFNVRVSDERRFTLRGGQGGDGGFPGGDSGWGGAAIVQVTESVASAYAENSNSISQALSDVATSAPGSTALNCPAGGSGGDGGNGGRHLGAPGAAGAAGAVTVGSPGTPGLGGDGSPSGAAGAPGSPGAQTQSSIGAAGSQGGPCPQQN